jgi:tetratricopeptide (TPR) repeat protein
MTMISGNYISYMDLGEGYFATKNYTEAKNAFLSAIKLAKESTEFYNAYYNLAVTSFEAGNYEEAIDFAGIANSYNDEKRANEIIGFSYIKLKDYKKAQKQFEELVKENPDNILFSYTLADVYFSRYKFFKAFGEIKRMKSRNPGVFSDELYSHYKIIGMFL